MPRRRKRTPRPSPSYGEEASLLGLGYSLVAGMDEVGRGPLAGPVVAGLVVFSHNPRGRWVRLVRDSKQLTPAQREHVLPYIQDAAVQLEVGICSASEIDQIGIVGATQLAMQRALNSVALLPQFLLLDAFGLPDVPIPQKAIIRGDSSCLSIAAASIVAKVARDRIMEGIDCEYPGYAFARNKGYATGEHLRSLRRRGPCPIHRFSFAPVRDSGVAR